MEEEQKGQEEKMVVEEEKEMVEEEEEEQEEMEEQGGGRGWRRRRRWWRKEEEQEEQEEQARDLLTLWPVVRKASSTMPWSRSEAARWNTEKMFFQPDRMLAAWELTIWAMQRTTISLMVGDLGGRGGGGEGGWLGDGWS